MKSTVLRAGPAENRRPWDGGKELARPWLLACGENPDERFSQNLGTNAALWSWLDSRSPGLASICVLRMQMQAVSFPFPITGQLWVRIRNEYRRAWCTEAWLQETEAMGTGQPQTQSPLSTSPHRTPSFLIVHTPLPLSSSHRGL